MSIAWERVRMFLPPAFIAFMQYSHLQNSAGQPSAAAVPKYVIFIARHLFRHAFAAEPYSPF